MNASPDPDAEPTTSNQGGGSGLPENVAGALSYLLGPITGVAFFIIDRERPFVRFHAVQSIAVSIGWVVVAIALMVVSAILGVIPILGWLIGILLNIGLALAGLGTWLWLMYQAYQGNQWAFPGLEPHVRRIAADSGGS
jgi:uncharacterized membrane protein